MAQYSIKSTPSLELQYFVRPHDGVQFQGYRQSQHYHQEKSRINALQDVIAKCP